MAFASRGTLSVAASSALVVSVTVGFHCPLGGSFPKWGRLIGGLGTVCSAAGMEFLPVSTGHVGYRVALEGLYRGAGVAMELWWL